MANPQGKGTLPCLQALQDARPKEVANKVPATLYEDFVLSALVLNAHFKFKPVPAREYYLYLKGSQWLMSLVAPHEWVRTSERHFVARCALRMDMTWQVDMDARALKNDGVQGALRSHLGGFADALEEAGSFLGALPYYKRELPYYQRVLASGLAASLHQSSQWLDRNGFERLENLASGRTLLDAVS